MEISQPRGNGSSALRLRRLGIDTYREFVVYMHRDCEVCRSEGFAVRSRVRVRMNGRFIVATLNTVTDGLLGVHDVALSEAAWRALGAQEGQHVELSHPPPLASDGYLRKKVYGGRLEPEEIGLIVREIGSGLYDDIHLAAFVTACAGDRLDDGETTALTAASAVPSAMAPETAATASLFRCENRKALAPVGMAAKSTATCSHRGGIDTR